MWKLVCFWAVLSAAYAAEQKVPVSVYYESLCPDSADFITKQLNPVYNTRLKNYMDLKMVPYGKASQKRSSDGSKWEFKCQHGPVECYGNKAQGCILKQVPNADNQMKYINCLMNQGNTLKNQYPLDRCISGDDLGAVTSCANGTFSDANGADILALHGDETARLSPPLASVPTIVFNRVYNKTDNEIAQTAFKKVLCSYLKHECPPECSSAAALTVSSLLALASLAALRLL